MNILKFPSPQLVKINLKANSKQGKANKNDIMKLYRNKIIKLHNIHIFKICLKNNVLENPKLIK